MNTLELLRENHNRLCELLQQLELNPLADFESLIVDLEEDYKIEDEDEDEESLNLTTEI